jgi:hypothetical protein
MNKQKDPEDFLRRFSRRTPPPDLRGQILHAVENNQRRNGAVNSWRRKMAWASLAVILFAVTIDAVLSRSEANRLSGIIGNAASERTALPDRGTFAALPDAADEFLPGELASIVRRGTAPQQDHVGRPLRTGKDKIDEI